MRSLFLGNEPKILQDTTYTRGFPEHFRDLKVETNNGDDFKFRWEHNENHIDSSYKLDFRGEATTLLTPDPKASDDRANLGYQGTYQFFMETPAGTIAGHKLKVEFTCKYIIVKPLLSGHLWDQLPRCPLSPSGGSPLTSKIVC